MDKQYIVSMTDLRFVTLLCRHCNTRVTLDFEAEFDAASRRAAFAAPAQCPRCDTPFDSAVPRAVNALQQVYRALAELGEAVSFTGEEKRHGEVA